MKLRYSVSIIASLCFSVASIAHDALPNTAWPYVFDEFRVGKLHYVNTEAVSDGQFNIHLQGNILHYINQYDGIVHKAEVRLLDYLEIDSMRYVVADDKMMQQIYSRDSVQLLLCNEADWDALFCYQGAAYGMHITTSASMATHPFNLAGLDRPQYTTLLAQKHDGRDITVHSRYYIYYHSSLVKVNKKNIEQLFLLDAKQFKTFIKQKHIDWQSQESLKLVIDYILANREK